MAIAGRVARPLEAVIAGRESRLLMMAIAGRKAKLWAHNGHYYYRDKAVLL